MQWYPAPKRLEQTSWMPLPHVMEPDLQLIRLCATCKMEMSPEQRQLLSFFGHDSNAPERGMLQMMILLIITFKLHLPIS